MKTAQKPQRLVKRRHSIRTKLIATIIPAAILSILTVIIISFLTSRNSIIAKTEALVHAEAAAGVSQIATWQETTLATLDTITTAMSDLNLDQKQILAYLGSNLNRYDDFPNGIYITYENAKVLDGANWTPAIKATEGTWYKEGVTHDRFLFGEPYIDSLTKEYIVTASKRLPSFNGKLDAVAAADVSLHVLSQTVHDLKIAGSGDAMIVDKNTGLILAHIEDELVGSAAESLSDPFYTSIMTDINNGDFSKTKYDSADGVYITSILPIEHTNWYMIGRVSEDVILKDLNQLGDFLTVLSAVLVIFMVLLMQFIIGRIVKPINRLTNTIVTITDGDFSENITVKGRDEVSVMASHMQQFLTAMREMIGKMHTIADILNTKAADSNTLSEELFHSADSQSDAMTQMNITVDELVRAITDTAQNATSLAQIASDTNHDGASVMETMQQTKSAAEQGQKDMNWVNQAMTTIENSMTSLETSIEDVGTAAVKINEITHTIVEIAEETNLLALNASIEAARAGEAGKGFSVVANQIKKLAETSASAADEIAQLIVSVSGLIQNTVAKSNESMKEIKDSSDMVNVASESFNHIYESINQTNTIMENMIVKIKQVDEVAASVAAITEEQSAGAQEIESSTASIAALAASVADNSKSVSADAQELAASSIELKQQVEKFKI